MQIHIISPKSLIDEFPAEHGNIYGTTATFGTPSAQLSGAEKWDTAKVSKIRWWMNWQDVLLEIHVHQWNVHFGANAWISWFQRLFFVSDDLLLMWFAFLERLYGIHPKILKPTVRGAEAEVLRRASQGARALRDAQDRPSSLHGARVCQKPSINRYKLFNSCSFAFKSVAARWVFIV